jgi:gamma-glutamyltranspeptidase/glutathione hydrolase
MTDARDSGFAHLSQNWNVRKPCARSRRGVVASQHHLAARVGARALASGGNAVDAAVAAGFALSAIEPWNSGLGGIGYMLVYLAKEKRTEVIDFGPVSPRALDISAFPLIGGTAGDLFAWPAVKEDRNVHGSLSFAVPGQVDGLGLALERFGTRSLTNVLQPAIDLAEQGIAIDWYVTLKVATLGVELSRYPTTREVWLPQGMPPVTPQDAPLGRLQLAGLADTLRRLARSGRRDFYEGEIADSIARDVRAMGGVLAAEDLREYRARVVAPIECEYRGAKFSLAPKLTAGPSLAWALQRLAERRFEPGWPRADAFVAYAEVLRDAYAQRLKAMGEFADRGADGGAATSTTHLNVIDRDGNMVALTQTLLSVFGSKVLLPETGILMNNGIMWFDPRPGGPNSLGPSRRPLTNMCPAIACRGGSAWFALGASGGRKIFPAVLQIASFLVDHGMNLEDAFHQPRIDASGGERVSIDPRLPEAVKRALAENFPLQPAELLTYPTNFACPSAVLDDASTGERCGMSDVMSPWSGAVAEDDS